jgi:hypothetical protein
MHWADLISNVLLIATASVVAYVLLLHKIEKIIFKRNLQTADQLASLDNAIRALETRLSEHHAASELIEATLGMDVDASEPEVLQEETQTEQVAADIQAVIAAAAVAALGRDAHVRSIRPATNSWSQQGRVLVQGSHNARARR